MMFEYEQCQNDHLHTEVPRQSVTMCRYIMYVETVAWYCTWVISHEVQPSPQLVRAGLNGAQADRPLKGRA